jgi:cell wall-associated NlpC family hydrolase
MIAGDLVIFDWGDGGITDHVAIYAGKGQVIGGNQGNRVSKVPLSRPNIVGVVRPNASTS